MKVININTIDDFHKRLENYRKSSWFKFRGQSESSWELIPKAGRPPFTNVNDKDAFGHWKRRAIAYLDKDYSTDWELLAIAQHTGLPTRLLDWTHNPLAAAFFATAENYESDGAIYIYKPDTLVNHEVVNPFEIKNLNNKVGFHQPNASSHRIVNQFGYFSVHAIPTLALNDKTKDGYLEKIIIKKEMKKDIMFMLNQYGVNYLTLFPDLEGLSKHLCWYAENNKFWDKTFDDKL